MIYLILGIAGLLVIVALYTCLGSNRDRSDGEDDEIAAPPADCCGAHAICEKGLKKADSHIDYFEDEELDAFKGTAADAYTDDQIEIFRDILYTLKTEEIADWLISLEKRQVNLPEILKQEVVGMIS